MLSQLHQVRDKTALILLCLSKLEHLLQHSAAVLDCSTQLRHSIALMWVYLQGAFSHSLAEWALTACSWFGKDLPRLKAQQQDRNWEPYFVEELRYFLQCTICIMDMMQQQLVSLILAANAFSYMTCVC